ncbi:DUF1501 domain-containing protein [uncultured Gimesia sp.]|uniref:DUF1501 domain-containing protein n=1 Tax=uncultured Gimesia sp. TaxID=1678688 RepID=UPI0026022434|nr:DUF1501 domain-containing protein [uncultured Gimesia sp.]
MSQSFAKSSASSRRHFLAQSAFGVSSLGLVTLLKEEQLLAAPEKPELGEVTHDLLPKKTSHPARAKSMISIFCGGGPSHIDLFDRKPVLDEYAGKRFPGDGIKYDNAGQATSIIMPSPNTFKKCGESGMEINVEMLPQFAEIVDDVTLVRSMQLPNIRNHVAGMRAMTTGRAREGWPSLGSWITYGLGSETQNLPAFVAITIPKNPVGSPYWDSRQLPSIYQGTVVRKTDPKIANLNPIAQLRGKPQGNQLDLLKELNQIHLERHPGEDDLSARIASYELAARMQTAATEALDLSKETEATHKMYGADDPVTKEFADALILARRFVERGVRFVQVWNYGWDMHENIFEYLKRRCDASDKPSAALVKDLKNRGLLDSTIVQWGGEMGRLPVIQDRGEGKKPGRDHNTEGFSIWMAGGGLKEGHIHGATDDFGHRAVEDVVTQHDFHATLLHQFGLKAEELHYDHNAQPVALVEPGQGKVATGILK